MLKISSSRRNGFTLFEILVVIAIIAVLAALLFAAFARVREKGRSASCQSNLRQIAMAMQQYVGDNDGAFPAHHILMNRDTPISKLLLWSDAIQPYLKSKAVFYCPTNKAESYAAYASPGSLPGYTYNFFDLNRRDKKAKVFLGLHESNFAALSDVVLNSDFLVTPDEFSEGEGEEIETSCGSQKLADLHSDGANFSYGDGHIKWLSPLQQGEWFCGVDARQRAAKGD